ncbi:MAG: hypothetical protein HUU06_07300 [Planctomycetaceae bacterium]|nr:hypothetical protein [Planctomycetaceae bacterium]
MPPRCPFFVVLFLRRIAVAAALAPIAPAWGATAGLASPATAALPPLPKWSTFVAVDSAYGFKDNLLLSAANEERSAFAEAAVEALFMRVPTGPLDYSFFAQGEGRHFFSGRTVHNESSVWLRSELGFNAGRDWKLLLPVTGYYDDKVFDQSDTEVERLTAELKVTGGMAAPGVRWSFHPAWWIEAQGTAQRDRFADRFSDSRTRHGTVRLRWEAGASTELTGSATRRWRDYDTRAQYSAAGRELVGTNLKIVESELTAALAVKWGRDNAWQANTRVAALAYRDNGSGYFDHRERQLEQELEWSGGGWLVRWRAAARRVEFLVQTVGIGLSPTPRIRDEYEAGLRVEKTLSPRWTLVGGCEWERARSNDQVASYVVNEGLLGLRWSWEK